MVSSYSGEARQALMERWLKTNRVPQDVVNAWIREMTDAEVEEELRLGVPER